MIKHVVRRNKDATWEVITSMDATPVCVPIFSWEYDEDVPLYDSCELCGKCLVHNTGLCSKAPDGKHFWMEMVRDNPDEEK